MSPTSHVNHPAQVNQFFRIVNGKKGPRWNDVVNGHNFDSENCMAAEGAVAASAHTDLRSMYSPNRIRGAQSDMKGGIGVDDVDEAFGNLGIGELLHPAHFGWDDVLQALHDRRHVVLAVDYRKVPESGQLQQPGNFDHALGLDDLDAGLILKYDSLGLAPVWVPESYARTGAEALALRERGNKAALFAGITKTRAALSTTRWKARVHPLGDDKYRTFAVYRVVNGVVVGVDEARTGGFSANCTPPYVYRWPGHPSVRLVRLTSGTRSGQYIRSGYAKEIA